MKFEQLQEFRQLADECLGNAKDATFELADAVMTTRRLRFRRFGSLVLYFGVSVRAFMKRCKIVDQSEKN